MNFLYQVTARDNWNLGGVGAGNMNVLVLLVVILLIVLLIVAISRRPGPQEWSLPRVLYIVAFVCFVLAALGLAAFPWLPIGLACWVAAILAS